MRSVRIPKERFRNWLRALDTAEEYATRLREQLGQVTVILHGSYARGDFNLWSDIDLVVVSSRFEGIRPLDRYEELPEQPPQVEIIPLSLDEFKKLIKKPAWIQAMRRGAVIIVDDYGLKDMLTSTNITLKELKDLRHEIKKLETRST